MPPCMCIRIAVTLHAVEVRVRKKCKRICYPQSILHVRYVNVLFFFVCLCNIYFGLVDQRDNWWAPVTVFMIYRHTFREEPRMHRERKREQCRITSAMENNNIKYRRKKKRTRNKAAADLGSIWDFGTLKCVHVPLELRVESNIRIYTQFDFIRISNEIHQQIIELVPQNQAPYCFWNGVEFSKQQ